MGRNKACGFRFDDGSYCTFAIDGPHEHVGVTMFDPNREHDPGDDDPQNEYAMGHGRWDPNS
jgi:hypothetical protein